MSKLRKDLHEQNRKSWNLATVAHNSHKKDQAGFLRKGGSTLWPEELSLLGDLVGKRLVHLQCNAGQDSLSLASLGAEVTGVDISDEAVSFARRLSEESGVPGKFVRSDVYDWLEATPAGSFDIVYCSYGALIWLSDISLWGRGVAKILRPGGQLVTVDAHPFMMMFGEGLELKYEYGGGATVEDPGVHDYVASAGAALAPSGYEEGVKDFKNTERDISFQWGLAEILAALIEPGLRIERYVEYPFTKWKAFPAMVEDQDHNFVLPRPLPQMPMMFGLVATKQPSP